MGLYIGNNKYKVMIGNQRGSFVTEDKVLPYGAVDMGLPSGTLWAQGNIVKDAQDNYYMGEPTEIGCYFSWGNIDGHNTYNEDHYSFDPTNYNASPGGQLTASIPSNDAEHDAAVARLGNGWRMPTSDNFIELFNSNYTTWQWSQINGITGLLIVSKSNYNQVFLRASGSRYYQNNDSVDNVIYYWSSTLGRSCFAVKSQNRLEPSFTIGQRIAGFTIRPVHNAI